LEQAKSTYAEISEWPLTQCISTPGLLVHNSVLEVRYRQYAVSAQLQQEPSVIRRPTSIVPNLFTEITQIIAISLDLTLRVGNFGKVGVGHFTSHSATLGPVSNH